MHAGRIGGGEASNHRLERTVTRGWLCAASTPRYFALASRRTRLRAAAKPHR
jgi:hypothetical protein